MQTRGDLFGSKSPNASHVIAGFRYQLLQSIITLIGLQEGERLLLEVSEDFSVVSNSTSTDVQVKNSQAVAGPRPFSLQSPEPRAALERFWKASNEEPSTERRLVFIARGGPAVERDYTFPNGVPGLTYWAAAAIDADTHPIRASLQALFSEKALGHWLRSNPTDEELRRRLLRRVSWQLNEQPADTLVTQTRDQISTIYYSKGLPVSAASQAVNSLISLAFERASLPDAAHRTLSLIDLHHVLESAAGVSLVAQAMAGTRPSESPAQPAFLVSEVASLPPSLAKRSATTTTLLEQATGRPLVWLYGANGVGKSTLARIMARNLGGRWLTIDLRPIQTDTAAMSAAWRELLRESTAGAPPDGIIVDDFSAEIPPALWSRLVGLVQTVGSRGGRVIVTSNREFLPARLVEIGPTAVASIQAPYFNQSDIAELVSMTPAPEQDMIQPWSVMIQLTTGGGQPVLVAAKTASIRARGWPRSALTEDITSPSDAIRLSREQARRTLLQDLREMDEARSLEAGKLLRRIACLFDRADEELIRRLAQELPVLESGSDALSILRGTWLEVLPFGDLRISPLLADLAKDVSAEDAKKWRRLAAEYWLSKQTLNERTLPLCFWNALLGEHDAVLLKLCVVFQMMPRDKLRAAAPLLSPIAALDTDKPIYRTHPVVAMYLRLLQFEIADAIEEADTAARVAARLLVELKGLPEEIRALMTMATSAKVLMAPSANIRPSMRLQFALRLREAWPQARELSEGRAAFDRKLLPPGFTAEMDFADFLFAFVVARTSRSQDSLETFQALSTLDTNTRNRFIDAINSIYSGPVALVGAGWSHDQTSDRDMSDSLRCYDSIEEIVRDWNRPDIEAEVACARSVILDEGLDRRDDAILALDSAISRLGNTPVLIRQKAKVLAHLGNHDVATQLLLSIEDQVGSDSPFDRVLALRDGGISAAKVHQFDVAVRLFSKAIGAAATTDSISAPLKCALLVEKALALWRANKKAEALTVAGDTLDAAKMFSPGESRQAERSHQYARAVIGLFFSEAVSDDKGSAPPFTIGDASSLESVSAKVRDLNLAPLADNWRALAAVEAQLETEAGIDARSIVEQTDTLNGSIELHIHALRYGAALKSNKLEKTLLIGLEFAIACRAIQLAVPDEKGQKRIAAAEFSAANAKNLSVDLIGNELVRQILLDCLLMQIANGGIDRNFIELFAKKVIAIFGSSDAVDAMMRAVSERSDEPPTGRAESLAWGISVPAKEVYEDPAIRFGRDMMIMAHLPHSLGRKTLTSGTLLRIGEGWMFVLDRQRFRLRNPEKHAPAIEAAITEISTKGLSAAAELLLIVAESVNHRFADPWMEHLRVLRGDAKS